MGTPVPSPFHIEVQTDRDVVTVLLAGELDVGAAPCFETCLDGAIDSMNGVVVVDVGRLTFIDSRGMSSLLEMRRRLEDEHRQLQLINISPKIKRFFEIAGLTELFDDQVGSNCGRPARGCSSP